MEESKAHLSGNVQQYLVSDMEMPSLHLAPLVFHLSLAQYFLTLLHFLCFGIVMYVM